MIIQRRTKYIQFFIHLQILAHVLNLERYIEYSVDVRSQSKYDIK